MLTPEEIVLEWLAAYNPETHTGPSPIRLTERIRAYGAECAAQERERIIDEVVRPLGWRDGATDGMRVAVTTIIAAIRALTSPP